MSQDEKKPGDVIQASISGPVSGQVAVGKDVVQTRTEGAGAAGVTSAEMEALRELLAQLKAQVEAEAPPEKKAAARERVEELEQAVTAKEPDLTTMEYVKRWFVKNLPGMVGAVTGVVIHPVVGKLVAAVGDALADDFRRRFGVK